MVHGQSRPAPRRALYLVSLALLTCVACDDAEPEAMPEAETEIQFNASPLTWEKQNFIVVDTSTMQAWSTKQIDRAAFDALVLPQPWIKDHLDLSLVRDAQFLRSPDAPTDGPTSKQTLFGGIKFEHSISITSGSEALDPEGILSGSRLTKYHRVTYPVMDGNQVRTLIDPEGQSYILINRKPEREADRGQLPEGWVRQDYQLAEDFVLEFRGEYLSIHDSIGDLYQGPVDLSDLEAL